MSVDDEILQEFLVEAGELYELLSDQLVELENTPQDSELLNAIFRAFHTIKGGAGFMKLTPMVEVCHRAEDVFGLLRNEEISVDAGMIDVMFQVLDVLGEMFDRVRESEDLLPADPELLQKLDTYLNGGGVAALESEAKEKVDEPPTATDEQTATTPSMDDEFDQMVIQSEQAPDSSKSEQSDLITDDEFENLLDELHGKGKHTTAEAKSADNSCEAASGSDLITDEEFEAVLDQLHGKNKGPTSTANTAAAATGDDDEVVPADSQDNPMQADSSAANSAADTAPAADTTNKKPAVKKESTVRVDTDRLDDIVNLVGELVLVRNRLSMLKQQVKDIKVSDAISTLELVTSDLQSSVMKTRMQPIKKVFNRFPRVIRDLARKLNKDIALELVGEDTELDKSLVEALADPLIHLVRNSADHGIESPEDRYLAGKEGKGKVTLSARQEGDQILITVSDDGKGMDHNVFRRKGVESGMMNEDAAKNMTDKEAFNLIFAPGFSTKSEISDVSGRGVGMDVVKTRINELNGSIEIDSVPGEGSTITIRLPLTLAILPTLMVTLDRYQFALPLSNVHEAFNMEPDQINVVDDQKVFRLRDKALPLYCLHPWLVQNNSFAGPSSDNKVIVVQMGGLRFCLVVDKIVGQEEVVIKPLGTMLTETPGFSGATITGDGSIALILDIPSLMATYASNRAMC